MLVWFRLDLRLDDNPALLAAMQTRAPVIPVFIWAPEEEEPWPPGAASRWWLHQSLKALGGDFASKGSRLILRKGATLETLRALALETGARAIFWNRRYEPAVIARDALVKNALCEAGLAAQSFNAGLLFEPWTVLQKSTSQPFQVFSAFWKACLNQPGPPSPSGKPKALSIPSRWPATVALDDLQLEPRIDWAGGIRASWTPGEAGANVELSRFLQGNFENYYSERNSPGRTGTSRLSPHLHFGEISPRTVWHALRSRRTIANAESVDSFLREIGWREFAYHLLFHFARTTNEPLRREFLAFPWREAAMLLKRWQKGATGYPLIDAGMRELWATGWMHNRVRLVVASFLTKHLRINWDEGAYWFWDTLVDADLANNTLGWQWTAGCGADAAPYFRIFNPLLQSEKFDPDGSYLRRWMPELNRLPLPWIHKPWLAPTAVLAEAGVELGRTYPLPMVDHGQARREALAAFEQIRKIET
jgi:deoxyribodipyrimidine photo-lyase